MTEPRNWTSPAIRILNTGPLGLLESGSCRSSAGRQSARSAERRRDVRAPSEAPLRTREAAMRQKRAHLSRHPRRHQQPAVRHMQHEMIAQAGELRLRHRHRSVVGPRQRHHQACYAEPHRARDRAGLDPARDLHATLDTPLRQRTPRQDASGARADELLGSERAGARAAQQDDSPRRNRRLAPPAVPAPPARPGCGRRSGPARPSARARTARAAGRPARASCARKDRRTAAARTRMHAAGARAARTPHPSSTGRVPERPSRRAAPASRRGCCRAGPRVHAPLPRPSCTGSESGLTTIPSSS